MHRVPVLALHPHQQLVAGDAGVADEDVEPAVPLDDRRPAAASTRRRVGHVEARPPRRVPPAADDRRDRRGRVVAARRGDDQSRPARRARARSRGRCRATRRSRAPLLPVRSNIMRSRLSQRARRPRDRRGCRSSTTVRLAVDLPHQAAQHRARTHLNIRCDALRRKAAHDLSQRTGADTCATSASIAVGARRASARRPRWRRPARAGRATASARSSGASRSSAGFISAQWNGALTGSGIDAPGAERLRALARARDGVASPRRSPPARRRSGSRG